MRKMALASNRYAARIRECWAFDALYSERDDLDKTMWLKWARQDTGRVLYSYYHAGAPKRISISLKDKSSNIKVLRAAVASHFGLIRPSFLERIKEAAFLAGRSELTPKQKGGAEKTEFDWDNRKEFESTGDEEDGLVDVFGLEREYDFESFNDVFPNDEQNEEENQSSRSTKMNLMKKI